jgi:predicted phage tail protein
MNTGPMLPTEVSNPRGAGAGGKGGAQVRQQEIAPDNLRSNAYAKLIDLISEGEIEGFVDSNSRLLSDCLVNSVTVSGGKITAVSVVPGSRGYPKEGFRFVISDDTGSGAEIKGIVDANTGEVLATNVVKQGSGYGSDVRVTAPTVTGKAIYLDGSVLQNDDLTYNFQEVALATRVGTQHQTVLNGFSTTQRILFANEILVSNTYTVTVNDPTIDSLIVGVRVPQLYKQDMSTGDVSGFSVEYIVRFRYRPGDSASFGAWIKGYYDTISGKTSSGYVRTRRIDLTPYKDEAQTAHTWEIEIRRVSPNYALEEIKNELYLSFITGVTTERLTYPNSALAAIEVKASQFSDIPVRGYHVRLLRIRIPTNYFPESRTYKRDSVSVLMKPRPSFHGTAHSTLHGLTTPLGASMI